jgi:RecB family exonuclease
MAVREVSHSRIETYTDCPQKWFLRYQLGLVPPVKSKALDRGTAWHLVLQTYYGMQLVSDGVAEPVARAAARKLAYEIQASFPGGTALPEDFGPLLMAIFDAYVERWAVEDEGYEVVEVEKELRVRMFRYGPDVVYFKGFTDIIRRNVRTGRIQAADYKSSTGKDVSKESFTMGLRLNPQFPLYQYALGALGYDVEGFHVDMTRVEQLKTRSLLPSEQFARVPLTRTQPGLDRYWAEFGDKAREMLAAERGLRPITTQFNAQVCGWKCEFQTAHEYAQSSVGGGDFEAAARRFGAATPAEHEAAGAAYEVAESREDY